MALNKVVGATKRNEDIKQNARLLTLIKKTINFKDINYVIRLTWLASPSAVAVRYSYAATSSSCGASTVLVDMTANFVSSFSPPCHRLPLFVSSSVNNIFECGKTLDAPKFIKDYSPNTDAPTKRLCDLMWLGWTAWFLSCFSQCSFLVRNPIQFTDPVYNPFQSPEAPSYSHINIPCFLNIQKATTAPQLDWLKSSPDPAAPANQ